MQFRELGKTGLKVSLICLGTMTWGQQNTEAEAHQQLDLALESGVNFIDAAEMYPVPARAETTGRTESYIGSWLNARKNREQVILATKVAGPSPRMTWIRGGKHRLDARNINEALEASLKRLQTDYVDLYQIHWPDRDTNYFGQLGYVHNPDEQTVAIEETLQALDRLVRAGKVRHIGISNETPWGMMQYVHRAESRGLPRAVSIQNPYSLLNRTFEIGLAEVAIREQCGLLAYSPLAFGTLSGKYLENPSAEGRLTEFPGYFDRYSNPQAQAAIQEYVALAKASGLSPAQMALAFVNSRDFVTANIIGATTLPQLQENIASAEITLPPDVLARIEAIHVRFPNPSP